MKKTFMFLLLLLPLVRAQINEVMYDPYKSSNEWVEIYFENRTNLSGFILSDGEGNWTFPDILVSGYVVISLNETAFKEDYGFEPDFCKDNFTRKGKFKLANYGDEVFLINQTLLDAMSYDGSMGHENKSLALVNGEWIESLPTPGEANVVTTATTTSSTTTSSTTTTVTSTTSSTTTSTTAIDSSTSTITTSTTSVVPLTQSSSSDSGGSNSLAKSYLKVLEYPKKLKQGEKYQVLYEFFSGIKKGRMRFVSYVYRSHTNICKEPDGYGFKYKDSAYAIETEISANEKVLLNLTIDLKDGCESGTYTLRGRVYIFDNKWKKYKDEDVQVEVTGNCKEKIVENEEDEEINVLSSIVEDLKTNETNEPTDIFESSPEITGFFFMPEIVGIVAIGVVALLIAIKAFPF